MQTAGYSPRVDTDDRHYMPTRCLGSGQPNSVDDARSTQHIAATLRYRPDKRVRQTPGHPECEQVPAPQRNHRRQAVAESQRHRGTPGTIPAKSPLLQQPARSETRAIREPRTRAALLPPLPLHRPYLNARALSDMPSSSGSHLRLFPSGCCRHSKFRSGSRGRHLLDWRDPPVHWRDRQTRCTSWYLALDPGDHRGHREGFTS